MNKWGLSFLLKSSVAITHGHERNLVNGLNYFFFLPEEIYIKKNKPFWGFMAPTPNGSDKNHWETRTLPHAYPVYSGRDLPLAASDRSKMRENMTISISSTSYLYSSLIGYPIERITCRGALNIGLLQVLAIFQPHGYLTDSWCQLANWSICALGHGI